MNNKIVIVASYPESLINFRLDFIKEFLARNYQVCVIAPHDDKVMATLLPMGIKYNPVQMERNGRNPLKDISLFFKIFTIIKKEKPSIVFSYTIKPVIYGTLAAKLSRVPNIYAMLTGTGYIFSKNNLSNRITGKIGRVLLRFSLGHTNKLFFQNKDNVNSFSDFKLIKRDYPIAIINGSGVNVDHFYPTPIPSKISFLMISRLLYDKGIREYIAAASIIKSQYPNVTFKLVGWIDTNPNSISQKELNEWIQSDLIDYLGKLSDVRNAIAESSVYVLPSYGEGTPRTVLEAMAMARPIITTDAPGCRETVIDKKNGILVQVGDVTTLRNAMEHFITFPQDIETMGRASRDIAIEKYDVRKVNQSILDGMNIRC